MRTFISALAALTLASVGCKEKTERVETDDMSSSATKTVEQASEESAEAYDRAKAAQEEAADEASEAAKAQEELAEKRQEMMEAEQKANQSKQEALQAQESRVLDARRRGSAAADGASATAALGELKAQRAATARAASRSRPCTWAPRP